MVEIAFRKMHGCGNDFVVLDARTRAFDLTPRQVERIADRHKGVGFDQLVLIEQSAAADVRLRFLNSDGSEAEACGNATRCAARLLFEETGRGEVLIETAGGLLPARRLRDGLIAVEMAPPRLTWAEIPLAEPCDTLAVPLGEPGLPPAVAVSMGNPHAVFFVADIEAIDAAALGARLERHPMFPDRANIGFAQLLGRDAIRLRVFERGAGLTLACGSGACAALVAAVRRGLVEREARLILDGGMLRCSWAGTGPVTMIGPASLAYGGTLAPELLEDG
ncbi:MAG TPA: diaminopimelate epimerase [Geminicoccaceae bacterium]|nr:diaminopimelate epimerase [Geminicoccaceae bacterium]